MTSTNFRKSLNGELKTAGFKSKIIRVTETGVNTTLVFEGSIVNETILLQWLNKRFTNGISYSPNTDGSLVFINTPKQAEEIKKELETKKWAAEHFGIPVEDVRWYNSGSCYDRIGVNTKASADKVTEKVKGQVANGGMLDGMPLGGQTHYEKNNDRTEEYWDVYC